MQGGYLKMSLTYWLGVCVGTYDKPMSLTVCHHCVICLSVPQ